MAIAAPSCNIPRNVRTRCVRDQGSLLELASSCVKTCLLLHLTTCTAESFSHDDTSKTFPFLVPSESQFVQGACKIVIRLHLGFESVPSKRSYLLTAAL